MMVGIPTTSALDIALPAPVAVDILEEVVLTPVPTESNLVDPVESLMGPEDVKYIPDAITSPPEDEIMGLDALMDAELGNVNELNTLEGNTPIQTSEEVPVYSQEIMLEDNTRLTSALSSHDLLQDQPQSSQAPTSEKQQLREQLIPERPPADISRLQPTVTAGQKRPANV